MDSATFSRVRITDAAASGILGADLLPGRDAWLGQGGPFREAALWMEDSLRYLSEPQVKAFLKVSNSEFMAAQEGFRQIAELKMRLMQTHAGLLTPLHEVAPDLDPPQFHGTIRTQVADNTPFIRPVKNAEWRSAWWLTNQGQAFIFIQSSTMKKLAALPDAKRESQLLGHFKAQQTAMDLAIMRAKAMYPAATRIQLTGLAQQFICVR